MNRKREAFEKAVRKKLTQQKYNFRAIWVPEGSAAKVFTSYEFEKDVDFGGASFHGQTKFIGTTFRGEADFTGTEFCNPVDFTDAHFYENTGFLSTVFQEHATLTSTFHKEVSFNSAVFSGVASFRGATFCDEVDFANTQFLGGKTLFNTATFEKRAVFRNARFYKEEEQNSAQVSFMRVTFKEDVEFRGGRDNRVFPKAARAVFRDVRVEKPDECLFNAVGLRPSWFVGTEDLRDLHFTSVEWNLSKVKSEVEFVRAEVAPRPVVSPPSGGQSLWQCLTTQIKKIPGCIKSWFPHRKQERAKTRAQYSLLANACRELTINAEESRRYSEASKLGYLAMEAERKGRRFGSTPLDLAWWYGVLSGYSERHRRTIVWLVAVFLLFTLLYALIGFPLGSPGYDPNKEKTDSSNNAQIVQPTCSPLWACFVLIQKSDCGQLVGQSLQRLRGQRSEAEDSKTLDCWQSVEQDAAYSLSVMSRLSPEPKPKTGVLQVIVVVEGILGPLLIALFALAIRRRFMR